MSVRRTFVELIIVQVIVTVLLATGSLYAQMHSSGSYAYLIDTSRIAGHLRFLTSPRIAGRAAGTPQARSVAEYIASEFENYGLLPFKSVSYFQPFPLPHSNAVSVGGEVSYTRAYKIATGTESAGNDAGKGYNVTGYLPSGRKNAGYIVVGAHFDHIGAIGEKFYPGADDNASGVAALLQVAQAMGKKYREEGGFRYNVIFVAFDANNLNLCGSRYFAEHLGVPADKIELMVNIDQVGSVLAPVGNKEEYLLVLGSEKLEEWQREQIDFANDFFELDLHIDYSYYGSREFYDIFYRLSDQQSFTSSGIPALLFTSGITEHTNKESDTVDNISLPVLEKRIELIYRFLWLLM